MSKFQTINSSAELDYPKVLPTLDLNFTQERALDPRVVFARSSGGTYVDQDGFIKIAGVNQPRFDHDSFTGECLGLLVEESRTNIRTNSATAFFPVVGSYTFAGTSNDIIAPDGSTTTYKVISSGALQTTLDVGYLQVGLTAGVTYTVSAYYYAIGDTTNSRNIGIQVFGNGSASTTFTLPQRVWSRQSLTFTAGSTSSTGQIRIISNDFGTFNTVSGATVYLWGAQIEEGVFPTSYIATGASALTRSADIVSLPSSQFFNSNRGSINLEFNIPSFVDTNNNRINYLPLLSLDDNTTNNSLELGVEGANPSVVRYASGLMKDAIIPKQNLIGTSKLVTSFTSIGGYVAQSSLPSPSGDNDGFLFIDNATDASYHHIGPAISSPGFTNNFVHVVSVYAKRYNSDFVFLQATDQGNRSANAVFSFANPGAATQSVPGVFGTIYSTGMIDCGDGWYRLYIVFNISSTAPVSLVRFGPAPAATGNTIWGPGLTYTSSGLGVYFANPQIERACIIGKYISTTSGSVTNTDYYNSITKNKIWKMVYNYNNLTNETSVILDGKPFSLSRQTSAMPYNTLRIGSNSANTRSNAIVRRLSYYPNTISNSNSISLIT